MSLVLRFISGSIIQNLIELVAVQIYVYYSSAEVIRSHTTIMCVLTFMKLTLILANAGCRKTDRYTYKTSANPRLLRHGESCDYMLSSFKHRNKN